MSLPRLRRIYGMYLWCLFVHGPCTIVGIFFSEGWLVEKCHLKFNSLRRENRDEKAWQRLYLQKINLKLCKRLSFCLVFEKTQVCYCNQELVSWMILTPSCLVTWLRFFRWTLCSPNMLFLTSFLTHPALHEKGGFTETSEGSTGPLRPLDPWDTNHHSLKHLCHHPSRHFSLHFTRSLSIDGFAWRLWSSPKPLSLT